MKRCPTARCASRSVPLIDPSRAVCSCPRGCPRKVVVASKADGVTQPRKSAAEWVTHRERGSMTMLRIMTFLSLRLGRRGSRPFLHIIAAYFFAFAPTARRHDRAYLRKVLGREPTAADRYRHVLSFATTIHDRVYLLRERFDLFDITIDGEAVVQQALD